MTFAEFQRIPDPPGGRYELRGGDLVKVAFPLGPHIRIQWRLRRLLERAAGTTGVADNEFPFRPLSEYESWRADVAYISQARWDSTDDYFMGAPEIVIEVLSPSNRASVLADRRDICLANGSVEFWIVSIEKQQVEVFTQDQVIVYKSGQEIPLFFTPGGHLAVDAIFA
jgi:Uma2 family endonuclease